MGFSRQEYWSGLPFPSPGGLPDPGIEPRSPTLQADALPSEPRVTGKSGLGAQNEAGQRLTEFCQENALIRANTLFQKHNRRLYTWPSPDSQHRNQIDFILCNQRWRRSIQSAKTRPGADCGSDHELLIAKLRLKLKRVGKTIRPFRYDLSQIPYSYTVEGTKRFKRLDLIDSVPEEL